MSNRAARRAAVSQARRRGSWEWQNVRIDPAQLAYFPAVRNIRQALRNDLYIVQVYEVDTELGMVIHLAIRTVAGAGSLGGRGGEPPWRDLQRIKNEVVSEHAEAVQVYPRQGDVVDKADMYHLFVMPPTWRIPFGLHRENGLERSAPGPQMVTPPARVLS